MPPARNSPLRDPGRDHARVTFVELFFDLVFVFAVTQLSHGLLDDFTPAGALHTGLLLVAVWSVWVYTSWTTNWLDPERVPVRLLLFVLMLCGLVVSTSIPEAFGARGMQFALAYAAMQVGRTAFALWAVRPHRTLFLNFLRILFWLALGGACWIAGGLFPGPWRLAWWSAALALEFLSPTWGFRMPRFGRSTVADWNIRGEHMAERCGLFIIIALGESVLVTGATFATLEWNAMTLAAFVTAFLGSAGMWWIYFNATSGLGSAIIARSTDPGRLGRLAYTYFHVPIVAGIVVAAVGDEMLLAHSGGRVGPGQWATIAGGPALYLVGIQLFKASVFGRISVAKSLGIAALLLLAPARTALTPLGLGALVAVILALVAAWETIELRRAALPGGHLHVPPGTTGGPPGGSR